MSSPSQSIRVTAIFTDTSVLYNYSRGELPEAERLFEEYDTLEKVTTEFGRDEYFKVAIRRIQAYDAWEDAVVSDESSIGDYRFTTPDSLQRKDRENLNELQQELVANVNTAEALRRINSSIRQYKRGMAELFEKDMEIELADDKTIRLGDGGDIDPVTVLEISPNDDLLGRLEMDIQNRNDRRLLAQAAEWYNNGGSDRFITSDTGDFTGPDDDGKKESSRFPATLEELGNSGGSLQDDVNDHISHVYGTIDHLYIEELIDFVPAYPPT